MKVSKVTGEVIGIVVWLISTPFVLTAWIIMKFFNGKIK
jgi:hypothetical protein